MTSMLDIDNQLFENPPDQFKAPDGNLYLTVRSIVYDSWITWNDALPVDTAQREMLNSDQYANITELAGRIHKFHQALPGYKATMEPPFEFVLWWDPTDTDPEWNSGKTCRFMLSDFAASDLIHYNKSRRGNRLELKQLTQRLVEAKAIN